jgi:hypothetical protein
LRAGDLLLGSLHATLPSHLFGSAGMPRKDGDTRLLTLTTTDVEWARGAASLVLREVFRPPIYETGTPLPIDDLLARKRQRTTGDLSRRAFSRS